MDADEIEALLCDTDWERVSYAVTQYAWKRTRRGSWDLARDLAQQALTDLWERRAWDGEEPLLKFLFRTVMGLASNERRRSRNTAEVPMPDEDDEAIAEVIPIFGRSPEQLVADAELLAELLAYLKQTIGDVPAAWRVLGLMRHDEIDIARKQSAATSEPIEVIREGRRKLFNAARAFRRTLGEGGGRRRGEGER
jgi:DNA-directed RNA polymerase specialized sigma24 family protein